MKFFTPDLIEQFGSENESVALAAQERLEKRSAKYAKHLKGIAEKIPSRLREMLNRFYFHDSRVMELSFGVQPLQAEGRYPSVWIGVELDAPPRECLVLQYRLATIEKRGLALSGDQCPYLEWLYDEVECVSSSIPDFRHSILFSNGLEIRVRFRDFDFATLKPLVLPAEKKPRRRRAI